ncbi:hypothetical protein GCM10009534_34180 [Kribbella sandramycini]
MQYAWVEPEQRRSAHLEQLTLWAVQELTAAFLEPNEGVATQRAFLGGSVRLLADTEAEESKSAFRGPRSQVGRPVRHVHKSPRIHARRPFRRPTVRVGMDAC